MNDFGLKKKPSKWIVAPIGSPTAQQIGNRACADFLRAIERLPVTDDGTRRTVCCPKCGGLFSPNPAFRLKHLGVCPKRAEWHAEADAALRAGVLTRDAVRV